MHIALRRLGCVTHHIVHRALLPHTTSVHWHHREVAQHAHKLAGLPYRTCCSLQCSCRTFHVRVITSPRHLQLDVVLASCSPHPCATGSPAPSLPSVSALSVFDSPDRLVYARSPCSAAGTDYRHTLGDSAMTHKSFCRIAESARNL